MLKRNEGDVEEGKDAGRPKEAGRLRKTGEASLEREETRGVGGGRGSGLSYSGHSPHFWPLVRR